MIKANELRIGNYFYGSIRPKEIMQITDIGTNICKLGEYLEGYESIEPIPITPEILERLWFEKAVEKWHNTDHWFIGYHGFCIAFDGNHWYLKMNIDTPVIICYFKHLHQLQNLYFALTNEELTLK